MTAVPSTKFDEDAGAFIASMGGNHEAGLANHRANEAIIAKSECVEEIPGIHDIVPQSAAILIGASPTVADKVEAIRDAQEKGVPIFACNGVGTWMISQGLQRPDYTCLIDPRPRVARYLEDGPPPSKGVIASMSIHPAITTWLDLQGMPTTMFRSMEDGDKPVIAGGSTVLGRMMVVLSCLGYHHLHVLGASSDFGEDGDNHVYKHPNPDKRVQVAAAAGYPYRWTTPNLAAQGWEMPQIVMLLNRTRNNVVYLYEKDCLTTDYLDAAQKGLLKVPSSTGPAGAEHLDFGSIANLDGDPL